MGSHRVGHDLSDLAAAAAYLEQIYDNNIAKDRRWNYIVKNFL